MVVVYMVTRNLANGILCEAVSAAHQLLLMQN